jgi:preprotein translocase subunit SecB
VPAKKTSPTKHRADQYPNFLRGIKLIGLGLENCSANIEREAYFNLASKKNNTRTISADYTLVEAHEDSFDVSAKFTVAVEDKLKSSKALTIECVFVAHFHCTEAPREFLERFTQSELRLVLWPFFREFVSDVTSRMAIPPLLVPLAATE